MKSCFSVGALGKSRSERGKELGHIVIAPPSRPASLYFLLSTFYTLLSNLFSFGPQAGYSDAGIYLAPFRLVSNILPVPYILRDDDMTFLNLGGMNLCDELTKQAIVALYN